MKICGEKADKIQHILATRNFCRKTGTARFRATPWIASHTTEKHLRNEKKSFDWDSRALVFVPYSALT
jgi:hypothetical protein